MTALSGVLGDALAHLPLVPRADPGAPPLEQRTEELVELARQAAEMGDTDIATAVHHRAAGLAFDRGSPGAAYGLCNLHTHLYLAHRPLSAEHAIQALESQVTAADLLIREGRAQAASKLFAEIARAIGEEEDANAANGRLPLAGLTAAASVRSDVCEWWDGAHAFHGARALVRQGRWADAHLHLAGSADPALGLGEAQQIAVVAMALEGHMELAQALIDQARPVVPWEHVVARFLTVACVLICDRVTDDQLVAMLDAHDLYQPTDSPPFDTELTLAVADLCLAAGKGAGADVLFQLAVDWALESAEGYSARSLLRHRLAGRLSQACRNEFAAITKRAGLGAATVPTDLDDRIASAIDLASAVITNALSQ